MVLLYPTSASVIRRTYRQKDQDLRLHVRQFDPRDIYDRRRGSLDTEEMIRQIDEAFADVRSLAQDMEDKATS
jgi:hypothetical protein